MFLTDQEEPSGGRLSTLLLSKHNTALTASLLVQLNAAEFARFCLYQTPAQAPCSLTVAS
jgi:hypothetical protein